MSTPHLDPSELGTKSYWDAAYRTEQRNFASDADDEGTVWFSDAGAEERMVQFLEDLAAEGAVRKGDDDDDDADAPPPSTILDLGTGNGHLLFELHDAGFRGPLVGVDYSPESVALASRILAAKRPGAPVSFHLHDVLASAPGAWLPAGRFDVVLDKGTFDAVSLSAEVDGSGRKAFEAYPGRVAGLVRQGGRLLITSCNWTEEELRGWFEGEGRGGWRAVGRVAYPRFRFGGREGSSVVTLCFLREG